MSFHGGFRPNFEPTRTSGPDLQQATTIQELQDALERQRLLLQTLCRILVEKGVVQKDELNEWIQYMDGLDGTMDGKLKETKAPKACPSCQRMNPKRAPKCVYCGENLPVAILHDDPKMEQ